MMSKKRKIAVITGITSFLGRSTARYLLYKGFVVFGIVRPDTEKLDLIQDIKGVNIIKLDFDNIKSSDFLCINDLGLAKNLEELKEKELDITFIHFAWGATLDRNNFMRQMLNVDMSVKVLEFAKALGAKRFIFAGSQAEMSESPYGVAKKQFAAYAEDNLRDSNMSFVHLRIFSVYGKGDRDTSLIMTLLKFCKENKDVGLSSCNYDWNFLYINDFTRMIQKMIEKDVDSGTYDIASNDTRLLKDYVTEAHKVVKAKNKLNFGERPDSAEKFAIPNISKTIEAIGAFDFTTFKDGIKEIVKSI
ncbi:MAG: NAD(P)-dependent oxidoreductase [Lachnospiraceae bacterium]|nr:NAD(P)-dependent oxidoreductase [Lachnospiraceae bacterium]